MCCPCSAQLQLCGWSDECVWTVKCGRCVRSAERQTFPLWSFQKSEQFTARWVILSMISQPCRDSEHPGWCPNNRRWTCAELEVSEPSWDALSNLAQQDCNTLKSLTNQRCAKNHSTCCDHLPQSDEEIWSLLIAVWGPRPHVTTLKHHLLAAPVVTLHHAWPVAAAWVLSCFSGLRLGLVQVRCRRRAGLLSVWGHGDAEAHAESLVARDVVEAAGVLGRVVADGGVLVGALRARKRKTVWTQEVIQVLVAVARWQGCTAVAAVQREREATKPRVPAGVHGGGGVSVFYDVKLREILDRRTAVIVRVCGVDWGQEAEEEHWLRDTDGFALKQSAQKFITYFQLSPKMSQANTTQATPALTFDLLQCRLSSATATRWKRGMENPHPPGWSQNFTTLKSKWNFSTSTDTEHRAESGFQKL